MRRRCLTAIALALCLPSAAFAGEPVDGRTLELFGWVERVELLKGELSLKAKLDTGAATSSLDAANIERFEREGERWVRFEIAHPETGEPLKVEKPIVRNVRIVRHSGEHQRRPVVHLDVCFGPFLREVEFSLIDRSSFIYPVLLGRSALQNFALVDSGSTFINYPDCEYVEPSDSGSDA